MTEAASHPTTEQLVAFDQGLLPAEEQTVVERHVAACDVCCRRLEQLPEDTLVNRMRSVSSGVTPSHEGDTGEWSPRPPTVPPELIDHPRYRVRELIGA